MKREQGLLVAAVAILGLMTWSLLSPDGALRPVKGAKAMSLDLAAEPSSDLVVALSGEGDLRDALVKPQTDFALAPLNLPQPPLAELPVILPPPIPDSGADNWSEFLYRYPAIPQGDLDDLIDTSDQGFDASDESQATAASAEIEEDFEQDPSPQYAELYDSVRLDAVRTLYGWIRDEDRFDKRSGDPITFQQVRPESGQEIFAPRNFASGEYESFAFAKTLRNEIELGVRDMRDASA
ncbi:MAG: hypothetical protein H8E15_15420, partial [Planctomycetes bacterium]|nr:hypothetical protein [Planctomycetota bacterium]